MSPLHNSIRDEEVESFESFLVDFEEKIVGTETILDEESAKNDQKFPLILSEGSYATVSPF
jgi:hypothetical protein